MKRSRDDMTAIKTENILVLPSPYHHYVMWLTLMICPEWPSEIVTREIMPHLCRQEHIMYCYLASDASGFFRHRAPQNMWDFLNVYYTPLIELRGKGNGVTLCDELYPTKLYILVNFPTMIVSGDDDAYCNTYDITEETTYYNMCKR